MNCHLNCHLWADYIDGEFLENEPPYFFNKLQINGLTSNPNIFLKAITKAKSMGMNLKGTNSMERYESFALHLVKKAANIFLPLHAKDHNTGLVSIELNPMLANDWARSVDEAKRLTKLISSPNVMIKVPANEIGLNVLESLAKEGINTNATLIFSPAQLKDVLDIQKIYANKQSHVASIFVSRIDRLFNNERNLGISNAKECYRLAISREPMHSRPLFASVGVNDETLPKSYYLDNLNLTNAIITAPINEIEYFLTKDKEILNSLDVDTKQLSAEIFNKLLTDGINNFIQSFEEILNKV